MSMARPCCFITLTPKAKQPPIAQAAPRVARPWSAASKSAAKTKQPSTQGRATSESPTRSSTARTSSSVSGEASEPEAEHEDETEEEEDAQISGSTYVCELHDPKPILIAEQLEAKRVDIVPLVNGSSSPTRERKSLGHLASFMMESTFDFVISIGSVQSKFQCTPSKVLDVYRALEKDPTTSDQLRFIETYYFADGLLCSVKRLCTSQKKLADEIVDVLQAISDIDAVLTHPAYLDLIGVSTFSPVYREIESLIQMHNQTPRTNPASACMCDAFHRCIDRFGEVYACCTEGNEPPRFSTFVSESIMRARVLAFYPDTVYVMDKRDFRVTGGLKTCAIYGFGRRKLFEVVRTSRKEWSFQHFAHGTMLKISLERYMHRMNPHHMVAIKRLVPKRSEDGWEEECVCYLRKSRKGGYRCQLMAEVVSHGRRTTSIAIDRLEPIESDQHYMYITRSEVSGAVSQEGECSSALSVPVNHHKHLQRVHIAGGTDVLTFLALAASYDILVGAITYLIERRY